jgi:prevent-host-death family protein
MTSLTRWVEAMAESNIWKLQDAKARFSELVRRARAGRPQRVTVHGKRAVVIVDPERFDIKPKARQEKTLAGFIERSKKFRGVAEGIVFEPKLGMTFRDKRRELFDESFHDEDKT